MKSKVTYFEKYAVAPSPSRDYYGVKVFHDEVTLYLWKVSHGPHLSPVVRVIKFSDFNEDKLLKDEIEHVFGTILLHYLEIVASDGLNTLLTLPKEIINKLVKYLNLKDIAKLLCTSKVINKIFNTNAIWEILYKRLKGTSELTEMEKDLGAYQGFRKLAKDHHVYSVTKKHHKPIENKTARSQKTGRSEKISRSASVNLQKTTLKIDDKSLRRKQSIDGSSRIVQKPLKSPVKSSSIIKEKRFDLPKQPSIFIDSQNFSDKHAAGEGYQDSKLIDQAAIQNKKEQKDKLAKFKFINEDNEQTELIMQKNYLKLAILHSDFSDIESEDLINKKCPVLKSPRSIFTKQSSHTLAELKSRSTDKKAEQRKSKGTRKKVTKTSNSNLKSLISSNDKNDDLDESGMSYLMRRYLEASDDVARKFSDCERLAHSTRNSGVQVDMKEKSELKPAKTLRKYAPTAERTSMNRSVGSSTNIFTKLKSFKKN